MVDVEGLTKVYPVKKGRDVTAVDNLSFTCKPGEIYGLLGPNGAGKTTTLRMLSTALRPTKGSAKVTGFDIIEQPDKVRAAIGFLSAATGLYRRLTAKEMIEYFGRLHGMDPGILKQRLKEMMDLMDITSFANRKCDKLSTGQKQRVSICRSIIHDPPVMVFDEPAEGLDIIAAEVIVEFIRDCKNKGKCVIFSTHIMKEAEVLCDRIGIINQGVIVSEGTLKELNKQYSTDSLEDIFRSAVKQS